MGPMTPAKPYLHFPDGGWFRQRPKACVLWRKAVGPRLGRWSVCVDQLSSGGVCKHPVSKCPLALLREEADVKSGLVSPSWHK